MDIPHGQTISPQACVGKEHVKYKTTPRNERLHLPGTVTILKAKAWEAN